MFHLYGSVLVMEVNAELDSVLTKWATDIQTTGVKECTRHTDTEEGKLDVRWCLVAG